MPTYITTAEQLAAFCRAFPGVTEEYPFDALTCTFKVQGKIFALSRLDDRPLSVSLKCDPAVAVALRAAHPGIVPGYHLSKRHWNTVTVDDALPPTLLAEMIEDSWDLVVDTLPRFAQHRLR